MGDGSLGTKVVQNSISSAAQRKVFMLMTDRDRDSAHQGDTHVLSSLASWLTHQLGPFHREETAGFPFAPRFYCIVILKRVVLVTLQPSQACNVDLARGKVRRDG